MPEFVMVEKDGEQLTVHPTTVESHKAAGWKPVKTVQVEEEPAKEKANTAPKGQAGEKTGKAAKSDGKSGPEQKPSGEPTGETEKE